jgi:hypothetical protein
MRSRLDFAFHILRELTNSASSFCVIRGEEKLFTGDFRDIDCYVCPSEYGLVRGVLNRHKFFPEEGRKNEFFFHEQTGQTDLIIDLHLTFSIHGVNVFKSFELSRDTVSRVGIRFFTKKSVVEHAIAISIFQNKCSLSSELKDIILPTYQELSVLDVGQKQYHFWRMALLAPKVLKKPLFLIGMCLIECTNVRKSWFGFLMQPNASESLVNLVFKSGIYSGIKDLNLDMPKSISVKLTTAGDLRFAWASAEPKLIGNFISQHTLRARLIVALMGWLIPLVRPALILFFDQRPKSQNVKLERNFRACFFGTPSVDQSLLIYYEKASINFYAKFRPNESESLYDAKREFEARECFSSFQDVFCAPAGKLYKQYHITKAIQRSSAISDASIQKLLIEYTLQQETKALTQAKAEFLEGIERDIVPVNARAFELYRKLTKNIISTSKCEADVISLTWAHGDLTPWNMIISGNDVYVIDFEKFVFMGMPIGYDLVHYNVSALIFAPSRSSVKEVKTWVVKARKIWAELKGIHVNSEILFALNIFLVLSSYLKIAVESEKELTQYLDIYFYTETLMGILQDEKTVLSKMDYLIKK